MNCKKIREEIDTASRYSLYGGAVASHLNDCPDCLRYSGETASLLGLLSAQPRAEAPTDFEFRLRARLARAQDAAAGDRRSFLRKIWPETFSRGQMVTAAAALALVVTVSTFWINRDHLAQGPNDDAVATKASNPQSLTAGGADGAVSTSGTESSESESVGLTPAKFTSRSVKVAAESFQLEDQFEGQPDNAGSPADIAGIDDSTRLYNPETKRLLKARSRFYGAETVSISLAKPAGAALTF
jgi:hypothetical protein